jgi:hypothetical protein
MEIRDAYSEAIKTAKTQHWINYLEDLDENLLWGANRYLSGTPGDGGKSRIPTIKVKNAEGVINRAETNEQKSQALANTFFPQHPNSTSVPPGSQYPKRVPYTFWLNEEQLWRKVKKLKPHKAPGPDGIPNIIIKESIDIITKHLLWIY